MGQQRITVAELFAGVGGFRLGLGDEDFEFVWSNQWEPETGKQHAKDVYVDRWDYTASEEDPDVYLSETGHVFVNKDIHRFTDRVELAHDIPEHDLLVGGFPCQDYSVARTKSGEMGIKGKKGKLWEPIRKIIRNVHANRTQNRQNRYRSNSHETLRAGLHSTRGRPRPKRLALPHQLRCGLRQF